MTLLDSELLVSGSKTTQNQFLLYRTICPTSNPSFHTDKWSLGLDARFVLDVVPAFVVSRSDHGQPYG